MAYLPFTFLWDLHFLREMGTVGWPILLFFFSISLGEKVLLNINPNYAFSLEKGNNFEDGLLGIPLGLAINLGESWILRPEGGVTFEMGYEGKFYNFGLGISRKLGKNE